MPIRLHEEKGGKLFTLHFSGKLAAANYQRFVFEFNQLVRAAKDVAHSV